MEIEVFPPMKMPEPKDTGSSGAQEVATAIVPVGKESPLKGLPIAEALEGLAATRSRSLGGEIAAHVISATFTQLSEDLQKTKRDLKDNQEELKRSVKEFYNVKEENAVLKERLRTQSKEGRFRNIVS